MADDMIYDVISPKNTPPASSNKQTSPVTPKNSPRTEDKFAGTPPFAKKTPPGSPSSKESEK